MAHKLNRIPLSNLCEAIVDCEHKTAIKQKFGIPSIRTTDIKNGRLDIKNANCVSEETYAQWTARLKPQPNDLILAREAPVGEVGIIPPDQRVCLGQRTVLIRPDKNKLFPHYLLYLLLTPQMRHEMISRAEGSVVPHLNMSDIRGLELPPLPPLEEQKAIAQILSSLDDKIELNQQMNQTLEAIARALFKSWFIDFAPVRAKMDDRQPAGMDAETAALFPAEFEDSAIGKIPKGWKVGKLKDRADNPKRAIRPEQIPLSTPYIGLEHMPKRSIALSDWGVSDEVASNKYQFKQGEILFGKLRPYFHKVGVAALDGVCSTDILVIVPKDPEWFALTLAYVSSSEFVEYTNMSSDGTRMPRTNWQIMKQYDVILPPVQVAKAFNEIVNSSVQQVRSNIFQSQSLAEIRDRLLPKLLSGELRVKDAAAIVEAIQ